MRARGLKLGNELYSKYIAYVAPHAGAWVETQLVRTAPLVVPVAPHAGAWVETSNESSQKLYALVAPHAGAWVETASANLNGRNRRWSRPMRARGLKLFPF